MLLRTWLSVLLLLLSSFANANDAELQRLQSILNVLNQQLSATYQQFQMVEQARRAVVQSLNTQRPGLESRSYDQVAEDRTLAEQQERALTEQMSRLLAKAQEIENQMNPVLERIYQLITTSGSVPAAAGTSP